jgi:hypothetical protein
MKLNCGAEQHHYSMFDVGCSTCPQCLGGGVSKAQPFDLYIDVNTNQMHYAWQAGVGRSSFHYSITPVFQYSMVEAKAQILINAYKFDKF